MFILRRLVLPSLCLLAVPVCAQTPVASPTPRSYSSNPVDTAHGDRETIVLWPGGAPGALGTSAADAPKLTVYRAAAASGTAVVVCPGGGYRNLASDHEGKQVAEWLNTLGVTAFVLQYRVGPRYRHPAPLLDGQRALRLVRAQAGAYGVDPARVGVLGFSAGGHLASTLATHEGAGDVAAPDPIDRLSARPDFAVLAYPVITMAGAFAHRGSRDHLIGDPADPKLADELSSERRVTSRTPPTFLFHTADDATVPVQNSLAFYEALLAAKVPAELHVFPHGHHGVGLAQSDPVLSRWPELCAVWLRAGGFLR
jgi:acetyl esterase/lipase